jgi:NADH-quinone oxidoreductase subunit J
MLAEPDEPEPAKRTKTTWIWAIVALVPPFVIFLALTHLGLEEIWPKAATSATMTSDGSLKAIGVSLLTTYSLAFELISLVLLAAILGSLVVAREGRSKE